MLTLCPKFDADPAFTSVWKGIFQAVSDGLGEIETDGKSMFDVEFDQLHVQEKVDLLFIDLLPATIQSREKRTGTVIKPDSPHQNAKRNPMDSNPMDTGIKFVRTFA